MARCYQCGQSTPLRQGGLCVLCEKVPGDQSDYLDPLTVEVIPLYLEPEYAEILTERFYDRKECR